MIRYRHAAPLLAALACLAQTAEPFKIVVDSLPQTFIQQRLESVPRKLADRKNTLKSLFREAGCDVAEQPVSHSKEELAIFTTGRALPHGRASVTAAFQRTFTELRASANGHGEFCKFLQSTPRHHRFVFLGFAAEEEGLVGSS